jgi:hypothetical protein
MFYIDENNLLGYDDSNTLFNILLSVAPFVKGDTAEIGVFEGHTTAMILDATTEKKHWGFDTFEGIVGSQEGLDGHPNGAFACSMEAVRRRTFFSPRLHLEKGDWRESLLRSPKATFCFVYVDTGTYEGTHSFLSLFYNRIEPGGKIVLYAGVNCDGVKRAIEEEDKKGFVRENIRPFVVFSRISDL